MSSPSKLNFYDDVFNPVHFTLFQSADVRSSVSPTEVQRYFEGNADESFQGISDVVDKLSKS